MCRSTFAHPAAESELDDIVSKGSHSEATAALAAWADALIACSNAKLDKLRQDHNFKKRGAVFISEYRLHCLGSATVVGVAAVAVFGREPCMEIFASDVQASPWWHKGDPAMRADSRIP